MFETAREIWLACKRKRCPVAQPASDWTGDFPLPTPIAELYEHVGPDELYCYDETHHTLYLPSLRRLAQFQLGNLESIPPPGSTERPMPREWGPERLAIAIHHTYPFIFESETGEVTFNVPGINRNSPWQPVATLGSLADMMIFFGLLEDAIPDFQSHDAEVDDEDFDEKEYDDDEFHSPDFVPFLIEKTSLHIDSEVASALLQTMYG